MTDRNTDREGDAFDERLRRELQTRYPPVIFRSDVLWPAIARGIRSFENPASVAPAGRTTWWLAALRPALLAASVLALFIGGMQFERHRAARLSNGPVMAVVEEAGGLPIAIQSAGSRYVATIAEFGGVSSRLTMAEREIAREVAMAALYSAALELMKEAEHDEVLRAVAELVAAHRQNARTAVPANRTGS